MKNRNKSEFRSTSGFESKRYYDSLALEAMGVEESSAYPPPGEYPFTRGFDPEGFRERFWAWEMYAGFGAAEDANRRYRFLLENGATGGVSVALDLPTQIGYDSDHPLAEGEVGKVGVALDTYSDVERLLEGVDLAEAGHIFSTANCIGPVMYAWVLTYCQRHDIDPSVFTLQIQNDPIKEYYARGTHFLPVDAAVRLATDVVVHSYRETPNWLPISVSGSHMKQAGGSPAQEAAFTLANAIAYVDDIERKGLRLRDVNAIMELHFCTDMDFFEEVAKHRAVRRAWSEIAHGRFGVQELSRFPFRLHATTSGLPLTAQQPLNNIARITLQALAQILGGAEATRTASWDEALAIPTEGAAATSLRINQIIGHETGIADVTDPLGGSFYVEELTERMCRFIHEEIATIDELGGALVAATNGYYADALARGAYEQQRAFDSGERIIVGVNAYRQDEETSYKRFTVDNESESRQIERLKLAREDREQVPLERALHDLRDACLGDDNVMPSVMEAVGCGATIGEIAEIWRDSFGEYEEHAVRV